MMDTIDVEAPPATATDYESGPDDDQGFGLSWVAVFLIDLSYGGPEEGGWRYPAGILAIDPWVSMKPSVRLRPGSAPSLPPTSTRGGCGRNYPR